MVKVIRSFNASEAVNELLEQTAPKGKGFSAWMNKELLEANLMRKNKQVIIIPKSIVRNLGVEL